MIIVTLWKLLDTTLLFNYIDVGKLITPFMENPFFIHDIVTALRRLSGAALIKFSNAWFFCGVDCEGRVISVTSGISPET